VRNQTQVVILAAGLGTGLRPLTIERPKVLMPVCNQTVFKLLLEQLQAAGFPEVFVVVRRISPETNECLRSEVPAALRLNLTALPEDVDGTVPAVRYVMDSAATSVLVIYGDSLLSVDFRALLDFHYTIDGKGGLATILFHRPTDLRAPGPDGKTYHG